MTFVEAIAVLRRHLFLVAYGALFALLLATFSAYRLEGTKLVNHGASVYESTAVVAVRPGAEQPTSTVATAPPTTAAPGDPNAATASTVVPTTVATPPLAPLPSVVDSRAMYYTALSLKTVVVSPGFTEAVRARAPEMDGSVTAVVAQDTNTMDVIVDGSTPAITTATMTATLAELQSVVAAYSTTPATRFSLDGVLISAPSTPQLAAGIRAPLTFVIVLVVALALWWFLIRAVDAVQLHRRAVARAERDERRLHETPGAAGTDEAPGGPSAPQPRPRVTVGTNGHAAAANGHARAEEASTPAPTGGLAAPRPDAVPMSLGETTNPSGRAPAPSVTERTQAGRRDKKGSARTR